MTRSSKARLLLLVAVAATLATGVVAQTETSASVASPTATPMFGSWGYDLASGDRSVRPGDDFSRYASGRWLDEAVIPADRSSWSLAAANRDRIEDQLKTIIETGAAQGDATPEATRLGALYASFMDEARIDSLGGRPLAADLAAVRAADSHEAIASLMGAAAGGFGKSLFESGPLQNPLDPNNTIAAFQHGGLGMPDRDYYLADSFAPARTAYLAYVTRLLTLAGWNEPDQAAAEVMAFETEVARRHWSAVERRQVEKLVNMMSAAQLAALTPEFPWNAWLEAAGVPSDGTLLVAEKSAFPELAALYLATPVSTLQAWQAFHVADQAAPYLSRDFVDANFAFRGTALNGTTENRTRSKLGITMVNEALGEALGKEYVRLHFPASSKAQVEQLVQNLLAAMRLRIQHLDWMSDATRTQALAKVDSFTVKIGYPDDWRSYEGLEIREDDLYGNVRRAKAFEWDYQRGKIGKPTDKTLWGMTPQTINAYYNPLSNEIVFPAAILQAPMFDANADPAVNYGAIGSVIGHEITHGFDDQGRKTDASGAFRDWWTPQDAERFNARAAVLGAQFDREAPLPGLHINGALTMGENIADLAGLLVSLDAYRLSLNGQPAPVLDGMTGEQRFFLGYAQSWRQKIRDAALQQRLASDPHAPNAWRAFMPMRNMQAWYDAFEVEAGQTHYLAPETRAVIW